LKDIKRCFFLKKKLYFSTNSLDGRWKINKFPERSEQATYNPFGEKEEIEIG